MTPPRLDHLVVNVRHRMDEAARAFEALGFHLTPRGHHTLGSINHCAMTGGAYLELVGLPADGPQRRDLLETPVGPSGLVLGSDDADATHAALTAAGQPALPPLDFGRPVTIDGVTAQARFRTVRLPTERFPAGRVYHCQHLTPALVWHAPWLAHPNGFAAVDGLVIEDPEPDAAAPRYAAAAGATADRDGTIWQIRLAEASVTVGPGPAARFAALALRFTTLGEIAARAAGLPGVLWMPCGPDEADLALPAFDLVLRCRVNSGR